MSNITTLLWLAIISELFFIFITAHMIKNLVSAVQYGEHWGGWFIAAIVSFMLTVIAFQAVTMFLFG